jgi:beta-glucosidase
MTFPKGFIWGGATSAYQIEGATGEGGRGPSIWDMFCRKPGAVLHGESGDRACGHYHRYREDVALMQSLGLNAYRFSIAWPRVLPRGRGAINQAGLDFYDRLIDELHRSGITPYATLYHWDYPLRLYEEGGWLKHESSDWFADYAAIVVDRLSDRVSNWLTFNEPQIFVGMGYQEGSHAPGDKLAFTMVLTIAHNILLAHGKAVQAIRSCSKTKPSIGYAVAPHEVPIPSSTRDADIQAARQIFLAVTRQDCLNNTWWTDPVVFGRYPEEGIKRFSQALPSIRSNDMSIICQPLDFLGLNVYFGKKYCAGRDGSPAALPLEAGQAYTSCHWPVVPESLYWAPRFYWERYKLPVVISENGMAGSDTINPPGEVHDPERIDFLKGYLRELKRCCADGIDVRGYFLWSVMDNFEWSAGYSQRFGMVYVDYSTQKRVVKDSGHWYKEVIASNGEFI